MGKARTSAKPVRPSATLNLPVPSSMPEKEERDRKMGKWAKKVDSKKLDMAGMPGSFSLSHTGLLSLLWCQEIRGGGGGGGGRKKEGEVSSSSDRGTR